MQDRTQGELADTSESLLEAHRLFIFIPQSKLDAFRSVQEEPALRLSLALTASMSHHKKPVKALPPNDKIYLSTGLLSDERDYAQLCRITSKQPFVSQVGEPKRACIIPVFRNLI